LSYGSEMKPPEPAASAPVAPEEDQQDDQSADSPEAISERINAFAFLH